MSDENDDILTEESQKSKVLRYVGYVVTLAVIVVLGIYIFRGTDAERDGKTSEEVTPTEMTVTEGDHDETYAEFIDVVKSEIKYVFTIESPNVDKMKEADLGRELVTVRNKIGLQRFVTCTVGYRDKDLCSDGSNLVVVDINTEDAKGNLSYYQVRFGVGARTGSNGFLDYYATNVTVKNLN